MSILDRVARPIFQAPIGSAASVQLAAEVSNAGGVGSLAMTWTASETAAQRVSEVRARTDGVFAVNFILAFPADALDAVLAAGAPVVTFSWGISRKLIAKSQAAGACVGVQVGSVAGARLAISAGADFIICQGLEAGGHVQSTTRIEDLLCCVKGLNAGIPVIAAGGLSNADDVARCVELGADGAMLGTRFVATHEARAHCEYKRAIVTAERNDTSYTWCFDGGWPYSGHRVIRNSTLDDWEGAGCPLPGTRPGEGDPIAVSENGSTFNRYHMASPVDTMTGEVQAMALYAGTGSSRISSVVSAKEVVETLWSGAA